MYPSRRLLYVSALLFVIFGSCKKELNNNLPGDDAVVETIPAIQSAITADISADCAGYYQTVPSRYDSSSKKYPLIFFVHGIGELGNGHSDLPNMLRAGLPRLINKKNFPADFMSNGKHYSFIVVAPQFKKWPTNADVKAVLDYMLRRYRVDTSRIYMTGLSMGGGVTWNYSAEFGGSLAAVAPVCGGSSPDDQRASNIASFNLPVWAFHNLNDPTVPVSYSRDYVNKINSHHPAVAAKLTTWPTGGHDAWTKTYDPGYRENNMNVYEWMLQFTHKALPK